MTIQVTQRTDGWFELRGIPGWDGHAISAFCINIDNRPRVIGLKVEPVENDTPAGDWALTAERFRKLPMQAIAQACIGKDFDEVMASMDLLRDLPEPSLSNDAHQKATIEEVAAVYKAAQLAGLPPRQEIKKRLNISDRTMDRRINDARAIGLLDPYKSDAPKPKSGTQTSRTRRKNG